MKKLLSHPTLLFRILILGIWSMSTFIPASIQHVAAAKNIYSPDKSLQAENTVFAVIGDYGLAGQNAADVASLVKSWNPNFIVTVGDNNYEKGLAETIDQNIGQYYHDYIFRYNGSYGSGSTSNRFFPALGNHDWGNNGIKPYLDYFTLPGNERYYDFVGGSIHFFILDSDPNEPDETSATSKQAKWLKNGLAASTSVFNIVVLHHAPYSSGSHGSTSYMQWPFKAWGAHAVLSGHDHLYERLLIDDLPYFVNGVGGDSLYSLGAIVPGSQVRFNQEYGAMRVEASNTSVKFQFFTRANVLMDEYTISKAIPVVSSIVRNNPSPTNAAGVEYAVRFSEPVSGVDLSDFLLTANGISGVSINNISGSGAVYIVSVNTGTGNGTLRLDLLDNDSIINNYGNKLGNTGAGNGNFINGEMYTLDESTPNIVSILRASQNPSNAASVDFAVTFSKPVNGVDASDFNPVANNTSGVSISAVSGSGNIYTISVLTPQGNDTLRLDLIDNDSITDLAGNILGSAGAGNGNFSSGESYTIDKIFPSVVSIVRASPSPTNASLVDFIVNFSEPISGLDISDFSLSAVNISDVSMSAINGSGSSYLVTIHMGIGTGSIHLDLLDNDSITDASGNLLGGSGLNNGNFLNGETYAIEKFSPSVISITRANANPSNASSADFIITFSEAVTGVDVSDFSLFPLTINNASIYAVSGSANRYIVSADTGFGDGVLRLDLVDNDSILNSSGYTLGNIGLGNGNFTNGETYTIDKTAPVVTSVIRSGANPSIASSVDFIVTFSEAVSGVDGIDFQLTSSNISNASINTIISSDPFYVVNVNTGSGTGSVRLDLSDDDSVTDLAGNKLGGAGAGNGSYLNGEIFDIEKSAPTVTSIIKSGPSPSGASSVDFIVTFSEAVTGVDISDFDISAANTINTSVIHVSSLDPFYIVTVNSGVGAGNIRLDLLDNDSITDASGNKLGGEGIENGSFTNGESILISKASVNFPPPTLREPQRKFLSNNPSPSFSWAKIRGASAYEIVIAKDGNFTQILTSQVLNGLSYTSNILLNDGMYYWRVRAYDTNFQPGKFSASNSFTIDTSPPAIPALISPVNNAKVSNRLKFVWEKVSAATRYQIEIDNNADFSSPEWNSLRQDPNYQVFTIRSGDYFWHVRAKDMAGNWSNWSAYYLLNIP